MKNPKSVIQDDFQDRLLTGMFCIHHVFDGTGRRRKCEKYGFLVAITPEAHALIHAHPLSGYDLYLKQECQKYWEENIGTRQEFIKEFRRSFL